MLRPSKKAGQAAQDRNRTWRAMDMGMTLVTEVIAGVLLGWFIDWRTGYERTFIIVGAILGVMVGMTSFIRSALKENKRLEAQRRERQDS